MVFLPQHVVEIHLLMSYHRVIDVIVVRIAAEEERPDYVEVKARILPSYLASQHLGQFTVVNRDLITATLLFGNVLVEPCPIDKNHDLGHLHRPLSPIVSPPHLKRQGCCVSKIGSV